MVGFIAIVSFVVDKLRFSSSSCLDENTRKISFFHFHLRRSRRGEYLIELRNSVWYELCATMGHTTIKMNAHFVPRFFSFVCRQRTLKTLACKVRLLACMLVPS